MTTVRDRRSPALTDAADRAVPAWARRAATLDERLMAVPAGTPAGTEPHPLVAAWGERLGGEAALARRLASVGLTIDDVASLARADVGPGAWFDVARAAIEEGRVLAVARTTGDGWEYDEVVPFATLWEPWARLVARGMRDAGVDEDLVQLRADAHLRACADLGGRAALAAFRSSPPVAPGAEGYRTWVRDLLAAGGERLWSDAPVLARVLATVTSDAVEAGIELAGHLRDDRRRLAAELGIPEADAVVALSPLGDRHRGGRQVALVQFASGAKVIYKPRSVAPELALRAAATHVARHTGIELDIVPAMIDAGDHSWCEFVATRPCRDLDELAAYSRRAGAALALAFATATHDLHLENVIVAGDRPVLVDLECIATAPLAWVDSMTAARREVADSVLSTYLLPLPESDDPVAVDIAGLTGGGSQISGRFEAAWRSLGTAEVHVDRVLHRSVSSAARPDDAVVPVIDVDACCSGFRAAAAAIAAHGTGLPEAGPGATRAVLCDTASYGQILHDALAPDALRDGLSFSIAIDAITRVALRDDVPPSRARLADLERRALERMDIPLAHATWDSTAVTLDGVTVPGVLTTDGRTQIAEHVRRLHADRVHLQLAVTRISLETRLGVPAARVPAAPAAPAPTPLAGDVLTVCTAIGEHLLATLVPLADGSREWLGLSQAAHSNVPAMTGWGLYGGSAGCALYLAELARVTGRSDFADVALQVLAVPPESEDPSLADGLAGWAYAAGTVASMLGDRALGDAAERVARASAAQVLAEGGDLDLMGGATGIAAALAALAAGGSDELAALAHEIMVAAGAEWERRVASSFVEANRARRLGVAHGITGTALAAARVLAVHDDAGQRAWLERLLAEEDERVERRGGLPCRVSTDAARLPDTTWCWGVSGFAAARRVIAGVTGDDLAGRHVARAVEVLRTTTARIDRMCCGAAGWLGALEGGDRDRVVAGLVARTGALRLEDASTVQTPSLFRGLAGVGHQLLRTLDPRLPDVLTLGPARFEH